MLILFRGRDGKGRIRQAPDNSSSSSEEGSGTVDTDGVVKPEGNSTEKGKKGRPKSPCEPIQSEPYVNIEIVKFGRDPNNTFSSGKLNISPKAMG